MADLNRPTQSPVLPRTTSPFAAPPSPSALSPASTSTLSLPQVDILNQEQSIAGSTNSATRTLPSLIRLDETRKCEYRMSDVELIATNNPYAFCSIQRDNTQYPPRRVIAQCSNSHFTQQWESRLSDLVIAVLKDLPWTWKLDVLRRGFTVDGQYNTSITPIVLYLRMGQDFEATDQDADSIAQSLAGLIFNHWHGEDIYVEICKVQLRATTRPTVSFNNSFLLSCIYSRSLPFPGSSIGQLLTEKGKEKDCMTGTLTGYITTSRTISQKGYGSQAHSPSPIDQQQIRVIIDQHLKPYAAFTLWKKLRKQIGKLFSRETTPSEYWRTIAKDMKKWDTQLGTVEGQSRFCDSRIDPLDWSIVSVDQAKAKGTLPLNQHSPSNSIEINSGFHHPALRCFTQEKADAARQYFANGPSFKPTSSFPEDLNDVHVYLKPPSATTQRWVVANRHDTRSITQLRPKDVPVRLITLITPTDSPFDVVSAQGDSGSIILNRTYNPVGIITPGVPKGLNTKEDLTYVVPIETVLVDIAKEQNWKPGSVTFCSG
ncbi:hypothetical protein DL95DRAFT_471369 [Leptodontidium sp. 2 PMI_412]|nr:hypothetical protein DL95DRAFT_471369 [Leptodontidium sp. 2 PMI_412]